MRNFPNEVTLSKMNHSPYNSTYKQSFGQYLIDFILLLGDTDSGKSVTCSSN